MTTPPFSKLKVAQSAKPLVRSALGRVGTDEQTRVKDALARAAGQNGDRYLSLEEAKVVVDAFETASGGSVGQLAPDVLATGLDLADSEIESMTAKSNVDGISSHFTFQTSLEGKLIAELNDSVARAGGRRLDVNMMIFEFQSDAIEQAIVTIARDNPNVTFRIIADSGQASTSGGNALPSILKRRLPNIQVKYKKDFPYVWSSTKQMPVYNHGASKGLNHHKGFATFIDGMPDRALLGSFNWSRTADSKNYEDLTVFHNVDSATQRAIEQFGDEFSAYFNNEDASLSPNRFSNFRRAQWNALAAANGGRPSRLTIRPDDGYAPYQVPLDARSFDINGLRGSDKDRLKALVGTPLASRIQSDRSRYGRFHSLSQLIERVPAVGSLSPQTLTELASLARFGSNQVSVNTGSVEELDQAGFTKAVATEIVAYRQRHGDFESTEELARVPGMTKAQLNKASRHLSAVDVEGFFNSRPYAATVGGTGYGSGATRTSPVMDEHGAISDQPASVTVGATDLFNRALPDSQVSIAMYGMSTTSPEYRAMVAAARRGVSVRVVLNDDYTQSTVSAIRALRGQGLPIDVRVQKAKTMHQKFGVAGDDVFTGSANFSESSSTKHSENRYVVKNNAEMATAFQSQFELLWARSRTV